MLEEAQGEHKQARYLKNSTFYLLLQHRPTKASGTHSRLTPRFSPLLTNHHRSRSKWFCSSFLVIQAFMDFRSMPKVCYYGKKWNRVTQPRFHAIGLIKHCGQFVPKVISDLWVIFEQRYIVLVRQWQQNYYFDGKGKQERSAFLCNFSPFLCCCCSFTVFFFGCTITSFFIHSLQVIKWLDSKPIQDLIFH